LTAFGMLTLLRVVRNCTGKRNRRSCLYRAGERPNHLHRK
jgi:hypothetical protein